MRAYVAAAVIVALIITGCGDSGDEQKVADTVQTYLSALAEGDGAEACNQLTGEEAGRVFEEEATMLPELGASSCADALSKLGETLGGEGKQTLERAETTNVKVDGDSATAELVGGTKTVHLRKVDGRWFISGALNAEP
jgi:hypothetical protein